MSFALKESRQQCSLHASLSVCSMKNVVICPWCANKCIQTQPHETVCDQSVGVEPLNTFNVQSIKEPIWKWGGGLPLTSAPYVTVGNLCQAQTSVEIIEDLSWIRFIDKPVFSPIDYATLLTRYLHFLPCRIDFSYFYRYFNAGGPQPKQYFSVKIWKII